MGSHGLFPTLFVLNLVTWPLSAAGKAGTRGLSNGSRVSTCEGRESDTEGQISLSVFEDWGEASC